MWARRFASPVAEQVLPKQGGSVASKIKLMSGKGHCLSPLPRDQESDLTSQHCGEIGHFSNLTH